MSHSSAVVPERDSHPSWRSLDQAAFANQFVTVDGRDHPGATAEAWTVLREAATAAAEAAVQARALAALLDEALAALNDEEKVPAPVPAPAMASWHDADPLSPREREVLALVAEGFTNK